MRYFIVSISILIVLGQAFIRTAWTVHYQLNMAAYMEKCENKAKPSLHCDGKCHLKKQIAVSEQQDPSKPELPEGFKAMQDIQLFIEPVAVPLIVASGHFESAPLLYSGVLLPDVPVAGIFKPPQA